MSSTLTAETLEKKNIDDQPPKQPEPTSPTASTSSYASTTSSDPELWDPISPTRLGPGPLTPPPTPVLTNSQCLWDAWDPWDGAEPGEDPLSPPFDRHVLPQRPHPVYQLPRSAAPGAVTPPPSMDLGIELRSRPFRQEGQPLEAPGASSPVYSLLETFLWAFKLVFGACFRARRKENTSAV